MRRGGFTANVAKLPGLLQEQAKKRAKLLSKDEARRIANQIDAECLTADDLRPTVHSRQRRQAGITVLLSNSLPSASCASRANLLGRGQW